MGRIDYSLYLVTDRALSRGRATAEIVREAVAGGATCVQLREKHGSSREFLEEAQAVQAVLRGTGVPLIINDRVDIALAIGAEGVHLGQQDLPIAAAILTASRASPVWKYHPNAATNDRICTVGA